LGPAAYLGIVFWFQDRNNYANISIYPAYNRIAIGAAINGGGSNRDKTYPLIYNNWYDLKVIADSVSGNIDLYIDGVLELTYQLPTNNRIGQTGLLTGNSGGYFDDFKVYSDDIPPTIDIKPGDATTRSI